MNVVHLSRTPVSGAPERLSRAINRYSNDTRSVYHVLADGCMNNASLLNDLHRADIIHWHNVFYDKLYNVTKNKKHVIQYHTEPGFSGVGHPQWSPPENIKIEKLVINHYHSALNYFKGCTRVRNVVDLQPSVYDNRDPRQDDVVISFTPSSAVFGVWQDKGIDKHKWCINRAACYFKNKIKIRLDIVTGTSWEASIRNKLNSDIVLDECITPSYHLSSLEGLACGKPTICWTDERVNKQLLEVSGADRVPFLGTYVGWLEDYLVDLIERGPLKLQQEGKLAREWFEKYWDPRDIVAEYIDIYTK